MSLRFYGSVHVNFACSVSGSKFSRRMAIWKVWSGSLTGKLLRWPEGVCRDGEGGAASFAVGRVHEHAIAGSSREAPYQEGRFSGGRTQVGPQDSGLQLVNFGHEDRLRHAAIPGTLHTFHRHPCFGGVDLRAVDDAIRRTCRQTEGGTL